MENSIDKLKRLLEEKQKGNLTDEDKKKIDIIRCLIANPSSFFELNMGAAMGILDFLGVKEEERREVYLDLISPKSHKKNIPEVREIVNLGRSK